MLIGISGYIGSGKDTIAKMIQYLTLASKEQYLHNNPADIKHWLGFSQKGYESWLTTGKDWEVKKFAGKLKQMVSLLTGIPVADLEREEVKSSFLGPEWNQEMFFKLFRGTRSQFDKLCKDTNIIPTLQTPVQLTETEFYFQYHEEVHRMTARELLQRLGTDAMRNVVHPNIHVNALFADYIGRPAAYFKIGTRTANINPEDHDKLKNDPEWKASTGELIYPNWIISDVRFPNEAQAIKDRGGIVIRVNRGLRPDGIPHLTAPHPSETSLDNWPFDVVIYNDSTLEALLEHVQTVLSELKLI